MVLYINLENREDHKKAILEELKKMSVPSEKIRKISGVHIPKNGHKGCIQSHILDLRMVVMNGWDKTTIIEDDSELLITPDEFNNRLTNAFTELENIKWDVLMLCTSNKKIDEVLEKKLKYVDKLQFATSGICYIIKKHYVPKLLKLFEHCNTMMGYDNCYEPYALDQKWNELIKKDNWYALKGDNIIYQRNSKSSINSRS
jgi:GR25 family glycosyltransferase involved in LPS biosynthesis